MRLAQAREPTRESRRLHYVGRQISQELLIKRNDDVRHSIGSAQVPRLTRIQTESSAAGDCAGGQLDTRP